MHVKNDWSYAVQIQSEVITAVNILIRHMNKAMHQQQLNHTCRYRQPFCCTHLESIITSLRHTNNAYRAVIFKLKLQVQCCKAPLYKTSCTVVTDKHDHTLGHTYTLESFSEDVVVGNVV